MKLCIWRGIKHKRNITIQTVVKTKEVKYEENIENQNRLPAGEYKL